MSTKRHPKTFLLQDKKDALPASGSLGTLTFRSNLLTLGRAKRAFFDWFFYGGFYACLIRNPQKIS